ncbi:abortive infection family protein [Streptomonospora sediminis]
MTELIGRTTRGIFRDLMTGTTVGEIGAAFQDEGFAPNPDCSYEDSSIRRITTQTYLESVDWRDPNHVSRVLRVFDRLLDDYPLGELPQKFWKSLRRDGYTQDRESGQIKSIGPQFSTENLSGLKDSAAIREQLDRIQRALSDDPALAIGGAKELIESTAKVVLLERDKPVNTRDDLPALVRKAQDALKLHPAAHTPGPDGDEGVKKILGGVSSIATGVAELRNRGYGTGHGPATTRTGLSARHAHLAVNAAFTWCQLMLDTLADPTAPWRRDASPDGRRGNADA